MEEMGAHSFRKSVALIKKDSPFSLTPPDRYKGEGKMVYQVSPNPRHERNLRRGAEGIKRKMCSFEGEAASKLQDDPVLRSVVMQAYESIKNVLVEEMKDLQAEVADLRDWKQRMQNQITLRSLVEDWISLEEGKLMSKGLVVKVNESYEKLVEKGSPWRKCKDNNLYREIKSLVKLMECGDEGSDRYMGALEAEIEKETGLPGQEFVDLVRIFLECNKSVHICWDKENLKEAVVKARNGEFMFKDRVLNQWVLKMAGQLSRKHSFGDLGVTDAEIALGFGFDAL